MSERTDPTAIIAALVEGDRWLSADGCAAYLGLFRPNGEPNRRRFLERVACLPDFPAPNPITRTWKKSEVDAWATKHARLNRAA